MISSKAALPPMKWAHFAVTLGTGGRVRFHVNGVLETQATLAAPKPNAGPWIIGVIGEKGTMGPAFQGALDELRLWDRELSGDEVRGGIHRELRGHQGERAIFGTAGRRRSSSASAATRKGR